MIEMQNITEHYWILASTLGGKQKDFLWRIDEQCNLYIKRDDSKREEIFTEQSLEKIHNYISENEWIDLENNVVKLGRNEGHCLIIPKRHFSNFFESTEEEIKAIYSLLHEVKEMFDIQYEPAGYNIGVNAGVHAGQTIEHMHVHLIPRYVGDVNDPRGGVRNLKEALVEYDG